MRFGGPVFGKHKDPESWIREVRDLGYSAAYCPVGPGADDATVAAYAKAAAEADVVIAEVGAWSNPLSPDAAKAKQGRDKCIASLALGERIGARCCVNIAGSVGQSWHGPDAGDLTEQTFERIVAFVREIIDAVKPARTAYCLETMPWAFPHSTETYARLIEAIDRKAFGVHFDPVNMVNSPLVYYRTGEMIREFVARLGGHIRSCHAKDITLSTKLTVHLDETRPGQGNLDYRAFLTELDGLKDADCPLMMEHLSGAEEYATAAAHIRSVAAKAGVKFAGPA